MKGGEQTRVWQCCDRQLSLGKRPLLMGIVNVTPDSFSDGGRWLDPDAAVAHGLRLADEGADLLDIGGESTRPGSSEVGECEEASRILPVIRALAARAAVPISVDTRHPAVARQAVEAGACVVNDIMPFAGDEAMAAVVRDTGAGAVLMHMRGTPQTMAQRAEYGDVVSEVERELAAALDFAGRQGIACSRLVIDPGIGFAKNAEQNMAVLRDVARLSRLAPVLVGVSRKRLIGELCGARAPGERLGGSVGAAVWCALQGVAILRVHDVKETRQAVTVALALATGEVSGTHV